MFDENKQVLQNYTYYPFGMEMNGFDYMASSTLKNDYLYNGKELQEDFGLGWYDYGARFYDAAVGRWHVVDPMAESYSRLSIYNYVRNNPIIRIDHNGMWDDEFNRRDIDWVESSEGKIYWDDNAASQETTKEGETYLGKNVLVATHNRGEEGNEKINSAKFELYLESNKEGPSATIEGNTVPADTRTMNTLAEGLYDMEEYDFKTKSGNIQPRFIIFQKNEDGSINLELPTTKGGTMTGIYFHAGNKGRASLITSGNNPIPISKGCQTGPSKAGSYSRYKGFMNNWKINPNQGKYYLRANPKNN